MLSAIGQRPKGAPAQQAQGPQNAGQRCTQFMADGRDKLALQALVLGPRGVAVALLADGVTPGVTDQQQHHQQRPVEHAARRTTAGLRRAVLHLQLPDHARQLNVQHRCGSLRHRRCPPDNPRLAPCLNAQQPDTQVLPAGLAVEHAQQLVCIHNGADQPPVTPVDIDRRTVDQAVAPLYQSQGAIQHRLRRGHHALNRSPLRR